MLSIQAQTCQVPFSTLLAVWLILFWWEFSIQVQIKRELFELIGFIGLGFQIWQLAVGPVAGPQLDPKPAQVRDLVQPLQTVSDGSVKVISGDEASGGKDDVLDSANEADVSQGSVSLLDISATDDEDTRKCKDA